MAKFLLLTHIYPPAIDGGSKVIAKMGEYLKKNGHQILVLTSNCTSTDDYSKLKHPTVNHDPSIISLPVITLFHRPFKLLSRLFPNFKTFSKGPIFSGFSFLVSSLKLRPDFIIAGPLPTTIVLYARFFRFLTKGKLIINASFHHTDPDFQTPILLNTLKKTDYLWTLTDHETKYFYQQLKIPQSKLLNLGNGVDEKFLISSQLPIHSTSNLLYIGSFAAHKNLETLIAAFSLLPPNFHLTLAGQKTLYFSQIQKQIDSLSPSIKKRIKIIFNFTNNYLSTLLDNCSILISPSLQESFGLVLIEAMARAKPVLAAAIPASSELIKKSQSGITFSPKNISDLKNKILKLSSNKKLLQKLGKNGYNYVVKNYTWNRIGKTLCQKLAI